MVFLFFILWFWLSLIDTFALLTFICMSSASTVSLVLRPIFYGYPLIYDDYAIVDLQAHINLSLL